MYKTYRVEELENPSQYAWFRTFSNPCYGMNVKVDVSEVVRISKERGTSFFANTLYLVTKALNSVPEMRMREVGGEIRLYDVINPTFTVMTDSGRFANAGFKMIDDYQGFYNETRRIIEEKKSQTSFDDQYNDASGFDDYYITCLPWIRIFFASTSRQQLRILFVRKSMLGQISRGKRQMRHAFEHNGQPLLCGRQASFGRVQGGANKLRRCRKSA